MTAKSEVVCRSKVRLFDWQIILSLTIDSQTCVLGLNWVRGGTLNSVLTFSYINGFALLHMPILLYPFLTSLLCSKGLVDLGAPCPLEDVLARYVCVQIGGHPLEMTLPPSGGFNFFVKNYGQYWPTTSVIASFQLQNAKRTGFDSQNTFYSFPHYPN